jgi:hypothetical protein
MIFPKKKKMLQTYESAKSGGWLSRKICEGEMAILLLTTVAWQCPILLLLWTGAPFSSTGGG